MEIRKGETRVVVLLPLLRLAIKFPKIHPFKAYRLFIRLMGRENRWEMLKKYWQFSPKAIGSFKYFLLNGLRANRQEFTFYRRTRNSFLNPTYFSLFGIFNVQPIGQPCPMIDVDVWCQLYELTNGKVFKDSHCFANPRNFCHHKGRLRIIDYGSDGAQEVILEYGEKIYQSFDFSYTFPTQESDT